MLYLTASLLLFLPSSLDHFLGYVDCRGHIYYYLALSQPPLAASEHALVGRYRDQCHIAHSRTERTDCSVCVQVEAARCSGDK